MATPPFNISEAVPADDGNVSSFPAQERSFRDIVEDALAVEHDMNSAGSTARHKFGIGSGTARDAITDWVVGSLWFNTDTSPLSCQIVTSVGPVVWTTVAATAIGAALLAAANVFTDVQTIVKSDAQIGLEVQSAENTANSAAYVRLYKTKTGANNDFLPGVAFAGEDNAGNLTVFVDQFGKIINAANGSEAGRWTLRTLRAGATDDWYIEAGAIRHSTLNQPTNAGEINATQYFRDNERADKFEGQLFHAQQTAANGIDGGGQASGSYATRTLNSLVTNEISGAGLSGNQITNLPAGTYWIEAEAAFHNCDQARIKLRNITDGTDLALGRSCDAASSAGDSSSLARRFTLAATKTVAIQARQVTTNTTTGWGNACGFGDTEVYMDVKIWKVA